MSPPKGSSKTLDKCSCISSEDIWGWSHLQMYMFYNCRQELNTGSVPLCVSTLLKQMHSKHLHERCPNHCLSAPLLLSLQHTYYSNVGAACCRCPDMLWLHFHFCNNPPLPPSLSVSLTQTGIKGEIHPVATVLQCWGAVSGKEGGKSLAATPRHKMGLRKTTLGHFTTFSILWPKQGLGIYPTSVCRTRRVIHIKGKKKTFVALKRALFCIQWSLCSAPPITPVPPAVTRSEVSADFREL